MAKDINTRNPEPMELVGSKDLREAFKDGKRIRGSFTINGVEIHQMDANTPAAVVAAINAKSGASYVSAELDDQGHLVLIDRSGDPIQVAAGMPWQDPPATSTGDAAKDAIAAMKTAAEADKAKEQNKQESIIDQLGLQASNEQGETQQLAQAGFEVGLSAEDRRKRWEQETGQGKDNVGRDASGNEVKGWPRQAAGGAAGAGGNIDRTGAPQIPSNPTPGNLSGSQGRLDDGRGRSGTGGGQGESAARTVETIHQGTHQAPVPGA